MKKLFLFITCVFLIASCKEKDLMNPQTLEIKTIKDVKLVDGVLSFSSRQHLKDVIQEISASKEMENWYSNPEFTSLLKRQRSITQSEYDKIGKTGELGELGDVLTFKGEGDNKILGKIIKIPELSAVLNSKSYVIVSDSAYHIGTNEVTSIHIGEDLDKLSSFLKDPYIQGAHRVEIGRITLKNARIQSDFRQTRGDRRIYGSNEIISFGGVGSYRQLYVEYLKKNWIGWSPTEAPRLSFTITATTQPYGGQYLYHKVEAWNVEGIGFTLQESTWGTLIYYNFNANMDCDVFGEYNFTANF
ncbi:hypothetical protein [Salmonirosea aquatica]|uniref:DUF4848 domain-containing protein n=1 Tax=Salmonirosea aquatica TaxID=2654236 RepID=A0A7C9BJ37_9BACT|nr:hypothetical protein [Cytophagaceae bacterium SJW1-29]